MVSGKERSFLAEFLSNLKEADLFSLASTTTGGKITPKNKQDAIECIMLHSDKAETILKRKKITKDFLFNYLHAKKVAVLVSDEKPRLIQYILQLWDLNDVPGLQPLPLRVTPDIHSSREPILGGRDANNGIPLCGREPPLSGREVPLGAPSPVTIIRNNISINVTPEQLSSSTGITVPSPHLRNSVLPPGCTPSILSHHKPLELDDSTVNTLAFKFTEWFYNLLNKNFKGGLIAINSEHFWNDAEFILRLKLTPSFSRSGLLNVSNNVVEEEHVKGIENIIILLNNIKDKYQIYFSPNLCSDGVRGKTDLHGGVLVLACGTLHKDVGQMCGAFEQVFLIFRDPLTMDNWKIKKTELHLISVEQNSMLSSPTINDSSLKVCLM